MVHKCWVCPPRRRLDDVLPRPIEPGEIEVPDHVPEEWRESAQEPPAQQTQPKFDVRRRLGDAPGRDRAAFPISPKVGTTRIFHMGVTASERAHRARSGRLSCPLILRRPSAPRRLRRRVFFPML